MDEHAEQTHTAAGPPGTDDPGDAHGVFCPQCGARNPGGARFCMQCGQRIPHSSARQPADSPDAPEMIAEEVSALLAQAFRKHAAGDTDGAIALCLEVLKLNPNSSSAHSLLGTLYEQRGDRELAIQEFAKVLELNPGSIADRAKLDQLRDGPSSTPPPKVNWSRRIAAPVLTESPATAAIVAVIVFFLVLFMGGLTIWYRSRQRAPKPEATPQQTASTGMNVPLAPVASPPAASPQPVTPPSTPAAAPFTYPQAYGVAPGASASLPQPAPPQQPVQRSNSTELLAPAPVQAPPIPRARTTTPAPSNSSTVHLPDVDASSNQQSAPPASGAPQQPNPGRIQIVVAPNSIGGTAATGATNTSTSAMTSQVHEAAALDAQKRGDYRTAVVEYLKALDHAGDRSAYLHQLIGLCYQRLGQNESAVAHYNDAIADYKRLLAAGKNVDAANRGIKACEEGIKACQ